MVVFAFHHSHLSLTPTLSHLTPHSLSVPRVVLPLLLPLPPRGGPHHACGQGHDGEEEAGNGDGQQCAG